MLITAYADITSPTCPADQAPACNKKKALHCVQVSDATQKTTFSPACSSGSPACAKLASSTHGDKQFVAICK
jgi:hypothetical protein